MPTDGDQTSLYRLLAYGDFRIHNMSIKMDTSGPRLVTSLYSMVVVVAEVAKFDDWLKELKEVKVKKAWEDFWTG